VKKILCRGMAVVAASLVTGVLSACSGSGSPSASSGTTTTTGQAGTASIAPTTTSTSVVVPEYDPAKNTRKDVVPGECKDGGSDGWSFEGTVTNSDATSKGYSITVDFITVPGNTVMATRVITVPPVAPQATANWSVDGAVPGQTQLTCVVRQSLAT
jgi:hypothetical protein